MIIGQLGEDEDRGHFEGFIDEVSYYIYNRNCQFVLVDFLPLRFWSCFFWRVILPRTRDAAHACLHVQQKVKTNPDAYILQLRVYTRSLSAGEILTLMNV